MTKLSFSKLFVVMALSTASLTSRETSVRFASQIKTLFNKNSFFKRTRFVLLTGAKSLTLKIPTDVNGAIFKFLLPIQNEKKTSGFLDTKRAVSLDTLYFFCFGVEKQNARRLF